MNGTQGPIWLSYASPAIALLALFISFGTYIRTRPSVRVEASVPRNWELEDSRLPLRILVKSRTSADVQVVKVYLTVRYMNLSMVMPRLALTDDSRESGPDLPLTLEAFHQCEWTFDALAAARHEWGEELRGFRMFRLPAPRKDGTVPWTSVLGWSFAMTLKGSNPMGFYELLRGRAGVVAVVELGHGSAVVAPIWRLTFKLARLPIWH